MIRFFTAGESHGEGLVIIVEGVPANLPLDEEYIASQLARRQRGYGRGGRMLIEQDHAHIMSGVRHGLTLGSPIAMTIANKDWVNWQESMSVAPPNKEIDRITRLRPGHADLPGVMKYGFDDVRNVLERASARETAARVAAGSVARRLLEEYEIFIHSHVICIGGIWAAPTNSINWDHVEESPVRCADLETSQHMITAIDAAKEAGDTVGGVIEIVVTHDLGIDKWNYLIKNKISALKIDVNNWDYESTCISQEDL